jgi:hypothetical protein
MASTASLSRLALAGIAGLGLWVAAGCDSDGNGPNSPELGNPPQADPITVSGFEPAVGLAGDTVIVRGTGFGTTIPSNVLTIGGAVVPLLSASDTLVVGVLPTHASGGIVRVADVSGWRYGTSADRFELRAPASLARGFNGDAGQPVIVSDLPEFQTVDSTTTAIQLTGAVSASSGNGFWAIVDDQHFVRSQGQLTLDGSGNYEQTVPLFCGDQRLLMFFSNDSGRSFFRNDLTRSNCTEAGIRVQLSWDTDGTDVDTHLLRPNGDYGSEGDCYFANCPGGGLDWGLVGDWDNPVLDVDDVNGYGPENIFVTPSDSGVYTVQIHYYSDHGVGPSNAWVEVFVDGVRAGSFGPKQLGATGAQWRVCTIDWPAGTVTALR